MKSLEVSNSDLTLSQLVPLLTADVEIILTKDNKPFARLTALSEEPRTRVPGLHPGAFSESDDFNAPLPDDFWLGKP
jgi:antitoxin (DNA-binding transcriptional repressor) of toxin-antitoxin stability system